MRVTVIEAGAGLGFPNGFGIGSIGYGVGLDEEGRRIRFAGDWRPIEALAEALDAGEVVEAEVEGWQILGVEEA